MSVHLVDVSRAVTLDDYKLQIVNDIDRMALRVGRLLRDARAAHPSTFRAWVDTDLPFGLETARRLMAISEAFETLPKATLAQLPHPWQAMFALRALPPAVLQQAIDAGELSPTTTERAAKGVARRWRTGNTEPLASRTRHHRADIAAGALMEFTPADLNPNVLRALRKWLMG